MPTEMEPETLDTKGNFPCIVHWNSDHFIVDQTGCGKSTLLRLLLGFDTPTKGSVYYDKNDIKTLDLKSLRRKIVLDEATSALDNVSQKRISDALGKLKCTRVVIAHRLSTIKDCDRIIVLDGGRIVEDGTYETLIEKKDFFAELVKHQQIE